MRLPLRLLVRFEASAAPGDSAQAVSEARLSFGVHGLLPATMRAQTEEREESSMSWLLAASGWGAAFVLHGVLGVSRRRVKDARAELATALSDADYNLELTAHLLERLDRAEAGERNVCPACNSRGVSLADCDPKQRAN